MTKHRAMYKYGEFVFRYLCNQACTVSFDKFGYSWDDVTCKNCLKQKPKTTVKDT